MNYFIELLDGNVVKADGTFSNVMDLLGVEASPLSVTNDGRSQTISAFVINEKQYAVSDIIEAFNQRSNSRLAEDYNPDTGATAGKYYIHSGDWYLCTTDTTGAWDSTKFQKTDVGAQIEALKSAINGLEADQSRELTTLTLSGNVVSIDRETVKKAKSVTLPSSATVIGKNLFNIGSRVTGKIKNDQGQEAADGGSNYFSFFIPVHGLAIISSFTVQRFYWYDSSKTFIQRDYGVAARTRQTFPDNVYFVQVQAQLGNINDNPNIVYEGSDLGYTEFYESQSALPADEDCNIYVDGVNSCTVSITATGIKAFVPPILSYDVWEPESATDDYKCTSLGQSTQSISALTSTLKYQGFIDTYFDPYLGKHANGYTVTKKELGLDSGAAATGNIACPVFSYEFKPKYYNKTVLLSAGMNACEASTYFGLAYFINALMEHTDTGMAALYNSTRFVVIPVICPSGIMHDPLLYPNSNGVRINKNFEYYGSWSRLHTDNGGDYPDSEVETKMLKQWLNDYNGADLWIDCHSDTATHATVLHLVTLFCSEALTRDRILLNKDKIINFYKDKGNYTASDSPTFQAVYETKSSAQYPKTLFAYNVEGIPSVMMEQYQYSTAWGSNGSTNNDAYAIKHYVTMLRYIVLEICKGQGKIIH